MPDPADDRGRRLTRQRDLDWDGCRNVRDLGGLPLSGGGATAFGRVVRSDNPSRLTAAGWQALCSHGIGTVILLRTIGTEDPDPDPALVPDGVQVEWVHLEDATDPEFRRRCVDTGFWMTPLQWAEMLRSWPKHCADAVAAVVRAHPGGVVISCGIGRDRTGLTAFLLLALAGVPADSIAEDWLHSFPRLEGDPLAHGDRALEVLERESATVKEAVDAALALEVPTRLLEGGLTPQDLATARGLLVRPGSG